MEFFFYHNDIKRVLDAKKKVLKCRFADDLCWIVTYLDFVLVIEFEFSLEGQNYARLLEEISSRLKSWYNYYPIKLIHNLSLV